MCIGCDDCDALHGAKLQGVLAMAVRDGKLAPYTAVARQLIDDAQLTGRTVYVEREGGGIADLQVPDPPPRWLVMAARSLCRGELPDFQTLVDAVLARYMGKSNTPDVLAEMQRELGDALRFVDSSIMDVEVSATMSSLDPGNLRIEIRAKTPTMGATMPGGEDVEIPADILSRPRAEA